ncbi:Hypothetical predicted protein [Mytilus galloprovincialis]|uniref:DNA 3'-5' helicase n=1 Tax=Mytilus galloprovincialis TaxID=29158 RepID=A0A8B6E8U9_MYTGA|nr:Hypothetical predicted protein [Mytilus galloprovincialis]
MASLETLLLRMNSEMSSQYTYLKDKQEQCIKLCQSRDVLAVLPTGYGKTVIIQALPYIEEDSKCCLVINGLNAIIEEQEKRFGDRCINITDEVLKLLEKDDNPDLMHSTKAKDTISRLKNVDLSIRFILSHPENILHPKIKQMLMTEDWSNHITHVVIDEAHLVLAWGKQEFRPAYMKVGLIKTFLKKDTKILALTATANLAAQKQIKSVLQMVDTVTESPNRPNVFLEVLKRPPSTGGVNCTEDAMFKTVDPYLHKLKVEGINFPKTIMYVPLKWCGVLHHRATTFQEEAGEEEMKPYVSQYHAPQSKDMKALITHRMHETHDSLRLVFATEAYGTGIDVPDIKQIIHVGPPNTMETYVQEIGRCGRNGQQATAVLYYNNTDIAANKEALKSEMREYVKNEDRCRREFLLGYFGFNAPTNRDKHKCCDICKKSCSCDLCSNASCSSGSEEIPMKYSKKKQEVAKHMLMQYFHAENNLINEYVFPHLHTGLSDSFAASLASKPAYRNYVKLSEDFPMLKGSYLLNISNILSQVHTMKI